MKKQGGFTLIELVVVIVILGILAVTAAPRFLSLQDDARDATLQGLAGAITGAAGIVYGKAAIEGQDVLKDGKITVDKGEVTTAYGYPKATGTDLSKIVDGLGATTTATEDFNLLKETAGTADTAGTAAFGITGYTDTCVLYTEATGTDKPAEVTIATGTTCGASS